MKNITFLTKIKTLLVIGLFSMANFIEAQTYYWVGGAGDWHDFAGHWATTSGGGAFHAQAPQSFNDVVFDANSAFR